MNHNIDPDEAEIERQILEAEAAGTSIGQIEDAKRQIEAEQRDKEEIIWITDL